MTFKPPERQHRVQRFYSDPPIADMQLPGDTARLKTLLQEEVGKKRATAKNFHTPDVLNLLDRMRFDLRTDVDVYARKEEVGDLAMVIAATTRRPFGVNYKSGIPPEETVIQLQNKILFVAALE